MYGPFILLGYHIKSNFCYFIIVYKIMWESKRIIMLVYLTLNRLLDWLFDVE